MRLSGVPYSPRNYRTAIRDMNVTYGAKGHEYVTDDALSRVAHMVKVVLNSQRLQQLYDYFTLMTVGVEEGEGEGRRGKGRRKWNGRARAGV